MTSKKFDYEIFGEDSLALTKKGKVRKRKPKEPRVYFTQDTEDAIIEYLSTDDTFRRNEIYNDRIKYAFYKLAENIIHSFKFYYTDGDSIEDLKHEIITVLLEKLHMFNHSKYINKKFIKIIINEFDEEYEPDSFLHFTNNSSTVTQEQIDQFISTLHLINVECFDRISKLSPPKAYSYFGTIVKRYLIVYNKTNYKKLQDKIDIDDMEENKTNYITSVEDYDTSNLEMFIEGYIKYVDKHLTTLFPKKQDAKIADSIIELFRKRETLEIFNKKAIYIYIREMTDVSTPQITKIIKKLNTLRNTLYTQYSEHGYILGI